MVGRRAIAKQLEWTEAYSIGIAPLDYEHRNLFSTLNWLHGEFDRHEDADRIEDTLGDEIHARMAAHFALEEKVMRENKYARYAEHKAEHDALLDDLTEAMVRYVAEPSDEITDDLKGRLTAWILDHVLTRDKQMSEMAETPAQPRRSRFRRPF